MPINTYYDRNLIILIVMTAIFYSAAVAFNAASPLTYLALPTDNRFVGLPITIFMVASSLSSFSAGWLMDKVGRKPIISCGFLIGTIGFVLVLIAVRINGVFLYFTGIFIAGISSGVLLLIRLVAAENLPKGKEGLSVGVVLMGAVIAGLVAPWLFSKLTTVSLDIESLASAWFYSSLLLLCGLILSFFLRNKNQTLNQLVTLRSSERPSFRYVTFIVLCGSANHGLMVAMMSLCSVLMHHNTNSIESIYHVIGLHFIGMFLFSLLWGVLADRVKVITLIVFGWVISLSSSALLLLAHSTPMYFIAMFFLGVGWSMVFISITVKITKELPASVRGRYMGLHDFWATLIGAILSLFLGYSIHAGHIN